MNLGELYKKLRFTVKTDLGETISIKDFAEKIGLAAPRISELENNKREMSLTELKAYHKFFNVSFEYLLGETDVPSADEDIQTACKVTGLSVQTIERISDLAFVGELSAVINPEEFTNPNVSAENKSEAEQLALAAYAFLSAMGIERDEFIQYLTEFPFIISPIKIFETFFNHGVFDKICLYISFYTNQLVKNETKGKISVLDDNFEDYTIWKLQNLISSEFKQMINELKIANDVKKEDTDNAQHNPTQE